MPFEDDEVEDLEQFKNKKVTLKGQKNIESPLNKAKEFQGIAQEAHNRSEEYKKQAVNLTKSFIGMVNDSTLFENKTNININIESQVLADLANLGIQMNNDESQDEGTGSIGLILLLFKTVLLQRNKLNLLAYKLHKLESRDLESADTKSK